MTGREEAGRDPELRACLEQIAASAGSPPEHGLDRVAELRRRRTRHRRGAVATTMALAVSGALVVTLSGDDSEVDPDVAMSDDPDDPWQAALPDQVDVRCSADAGIEVPVASIRPQDDGLHLVIENDGAVPVEVTVEVPADADEPQAWDSGVVDLASGRTQLVQPVAPGQVTVRCRSDDTDERRALSVVDVDGFYEEPELACPTYRRSVPDEPVIELDEEFDDVELAVISALGAGYDEESDEVVPRMSYPEQDFDVPSVNPVMTVVRSGEPQMWVALVGDQTGPWDAVQVVSACQDFLVEGETGDDGGSGGAAEAGDAGDAGDAQSDEAGDASEAGDVEGDAAAGDS